MVLMLIFIQYALKTQKMRVGAVLGERLPMIIASSSHKQGRCFNIKIQYLQMYNNSTLEGEQFDSLYLFLRHRGVCLLHHLTLLQVLFSSLPENQIHRISEILSRVSGQGKSSILLPANFLLAFLLLLARLSLLQQTIHNVAVSVSDNERILKFLFQLIVTDLLLRFGGWAFLFIGLRLLFVFDHFVKVLKLGAIELTNLFEFLFDVQMFEGREIIMQIFRDTLSGGLEFSIPFNPVIIHRKGQPIHHQIIFHISLAQQCHSNSNDQQQQLAMQTFKEISYQNYIELRFNQKNLQELEQQQALLKYKRNAQLLAEIFSFEKKTKPTFKAAPTVSAQHLEQLSREVERQKIEGELRCKEVEEKSKSYCQLFKKIKEVKTQDQRKKVIEQLKAADLYDHRHPYFAENSPFKLNNTDEEILEVNEKCQIPDDSTLSLIEIK